ncbi:unnamed protein product [Penicillium olsonii]|nr:unnamed protein product [Penicillium olsonii]
MSSMSTPPLHHMTWSIHPSRLASVMDVDSCHQCPLSYFVIRHDKQIMSSICYGCPHIPLLVWFLPCMGAQAPVQQPNHTASFLSSSSLPWWASALEQSMRSGQGKGGKQKRKEKKMSLFICVCFVGPHCVCVRFVSCIISRSRSLVSRLRLSSLVSGLQSLVSRLWSSVSRLLSSVSTLVFSLSTLVFISRLQSLDSRLQILVFRLSSLVFSLDSRLQSLDSRLQSLVSHLTYLMSGL